MSQNIYKKISIGTAQFGLDYGITNSKGKVNKNTVAKILDQASLFGINNLDTASS